MSNRAINVIICGTIIPSVILMTSPGRIYTICHLASVVAIFCLGIHELLNIQWISLSVLTCITTTKVRQAA